VSADYCCVAAYFTQATVDQLGTIDSIPEVRSLVVPEGLYRSTRVSKSRKQEDSRGRPDGGSSPTASTSTRAYAPFPSGYPSSPSFHYHPMLSQQPYSVYEQLSQNDHYHHTRALSYSTPQYSIPPPLPPSQSCNHKYQPDQAHHPDHGQLDAFSRRTFLHGVVHLSSHTPSHVPPSNPSSSSLPSVTSTGSHSALKSDPHDISGHSSPVTQTFLERQFSLFPTQPESPSTHGLRHRSHPDPGSDDITSNPYSSPNHIQSDSRSLSTNSRIPAPLLGYIPGPRCSSARSSSGSPHPNSDSTESCSEGNGSGTTGPCRLGLAELAPLHSLQKAHPYRRLPFDESALRRCGLRTKSRTRSVRYPPFDR
jgi:hypothetical protein